MSRSILLALLVVLSGLRLRAVNASPISADGSELNGVEKSTTDAERKIMHILEKLEKDGMVEIPLSSPDRKLVLMLVNNDSGTGSESLGRSLDRRLFVDKRWGPFSYVIYGQWMNPSNKVTFEQLLSMMNSLQKEQGTV